MRVWQWPQDEVCFGFLICPAGENWTLIFASVITLTVTITFNRLRPPSWLVHQKCMPSWILTSEGQQSVPKLLHSTKWTLQTRQYWERSLVKYLLGRVIIHPELTLNALTKIISKIEWISVRSSRRRPSWLVVDHQLLLLKQMALLGNERS